ncbi:hypothetical protein ACXR2W_05745 [Leucobacter sp. HY1908]
MFEPQNRSLLTDSLQPPRGYELVQAVGTTFTLDLATALAVPLAFASKNLAGHDDLGIIAALTRFTDRITIFTQAGEIRPGVRTDLVTLLEPMLHTVHPGGGIFHPKVWLLEYAAGDDRRYRLLCLSRNLTEDRSWDLSIRIDGAVTSEAAAETARARNLPLRRLLHGLCALGADTLDDARVANLRGLGERLLRVEWELPPGVTDLTFHVLSGAAHEQFGAEDSDSDVEAGLVTPETQIAEMLSYDAAEALVISPFLSEEGLNLVRSQVSRKTAVISRVEALDRLPGTVTGSDLPTYVLDAQLSEVDDEAPETLTGLHAKAIFYKHRRYSSQSRALIGSANVTGGGLRRNVEVMLELTGHSRDFAPASVLKELEPMLEQHTSVGGVEETVADAARHRLEAKLRGLAGQRFHARVVAGEAYAMRVWCDAPAAKLLSKLESDGIDVSWGLHSGAGSGSGTPIGASEQAAATLDHLTLTQVSPFLKITLKQRAEGEEVSATTIVLATLHDDITARRDAILAQGIRSGDEFLRLLALLLDPDGLRFDLRAGVGGGGNGSWSTAGLSRGLFEAMLTSLARGDDGLEVVHRIYTELAANSDTEMDLPPGFAELWQSVWNARSGHGQRGQKR